MSRFLSGAIWHLGRRLGTFQVHAAYRTVTKLRTVVQREDEQKWEWMIPRKEAAQPVEPSVARPVQEAASSTTAKSRSTDVKRPVTQKSDLASQRTRWQRTCSPSTAVRSLQSPPCCHSTATPNAPWQFRQHTRVEHEDSLWDWLTAGLGDERGDLTNGHAVARSKKRLLRRTRCSFTEKTSAVQQGTHTTLLPHTRSDCHCPSLHINTFRCQDSTSHRTMRHERVTFHCSVTRSLRLKTDIKYECVQLSLARALLNTQGRGRYVGIRWVRRCTPETGR